MTNDTDDGISGYIIALKAKTFAGYMARYERGGNPQYVDDPREAFVFESEKDAQPHADVFVKRFAFKRATIIPRFPNVPPCDCGGDSWKYTEEKDWHCARCGTPAEGHPSKGFAVKP